jgi:hypothetical protein
LLPLKVNNPPFNSICEAVNWLTYCNRAEWEIVG